MAVTDGQPGFLRAVIWYFWDQVYGIFITLFAKKDTDDDRDESQRSGDAGAA